MYKVYDSSGFGGYFRHIGEIRADIAAIESRIAEAKEAAEVKPAVGRLLSGDMDGEELITGISEVLRAATDALILLGRLRKERSALYSELSETGWALGSC